VSDNELSQTMRNMNVSDELCIHQRLAAAEASYAHIKAISDNNTKLYLDEMCKHTETLRRLAVAEAAYRKLGHDHSQYATDMHSQLADVKQRLAAAIADATRYRWLKITDPHGVNLIAWRNRIACQFGVDQIDQCVDAAMEEMER